MKSDDKLGPAYQTLGGSLVRDGLHCCYNSGLTVVHKSTDYSSFSIRMRNLLAETCPHAE